MNQTLHSKNCLITGATGGLGKEIAKEFAKNGCNLFLTAQNKEKLNLLKNELELNQNSIKIDFEAVDLSSTHQIQKLVERTKNSFSHIDILQSFVFMTLPVPIGVLNLLIFIKKFFL